MSFDAQAIKANTDLLALVGKDTTLKRVASTHGGEWAGPCPFCGGTDRFRVWPEQDGGRFWCRQCGAQGDVMAYVQKRDNLSFADACRALGGLGTPLGRPRGAQRPESALPRQVFPKAEAPSAVWQAKARAFVAWAQERVWETPEALAYLREQRGLCDADIKRAKIGYCPEEINYHKVGDWGLPRAQADRVWLPRGWVIPCESAGVLQYVKVRRHPDDLAAELKRRPNKEPYKYHTVKGSKLILYGLDTLAREHYTDAILTEGEFDALLLRQHVGTLCGCLALGSASKGLDAQAVGHLVAIRRVWLALDADQAGQEGAKKLLATSARMHPLAVPEHDITDAWRAGHDLTEWVVPNIGPRDQDRRLMWVEYWLRKLFDDAPEALAGALLREFDRVRNEKG